MALIQVLIFHFVKEFSWVNQIRHKYNKIKLQIYRYQHFKNENERESPQVVAIFNAGTFMLNLSSLD